MDNLGGDKGKERGSMLIHGIPLDPQDKILSALSAILYHDNDKKAVSQAEEIC